MLRTKNLGQCRCAGIRKDPGRPKHRLTAPPLTGVLCCAILARKGLRMSALSTIKLWAAGALSGILFWEFERAVGGRRHRPAKDLGWLRRSVQGERSMTNHGTVTQIPGTDLWIGRTADGGLVASDDKSVVESWLDHKENQRHQERSDDSYDHSLFVESEVRS